jgi:hypothetical protein
MTLTNPLARRTPVIRRALTLLAALGVAACGSSGSDGPPPVPTLPAPTTPVSLGFSNGDVVTAVAIEAAMGIVSSPAIAMAAPMAVLPGDATADAPATHVLGRITTQTLRRIAGRSFAPIAMGVLAVEPCAYSGNVVLSADGAFLTTAFDHCSDYASEEIDGYFTFTSLSASGDGVNGSASAGVIIDLMITDLTYPPLSVRMAGSYAVTASWTETSDTISMTGSNLGWTDFSRTEVLLNFAISETTDWVGSVVTSSADFTLASTDLGGAVTVKTLEPFEAYLDRFHPYTGTLLLTGAGGSNALVTVHGDENGAYPQLTIDVDANGDGSSEFIWHLDWLDLGA